MAEAISGWQKATLSPGSRTSRASMAGWMSASWTGLPAAMVAAAHSSPRRQPASAATTSSSVWVRAGSSDSRVVKDCLSRSPTGSRSGSGSSGRNVAGSSVSASGLPAASASSRPRTSSGSCGATRSSSDRDVSASSAPTARPGIPDHSNGLSAPSRREKTIAIGSAAMRRAANASTSAEARSSQCASSATTSTGAWAAATASSSSAASATRYRSARTCSSRPSAARSRSRCSPGSPATSPRTGRRSWCSPANGTLASARTPLQVSVFISRRVASRWASASRVVLPMPGSPCSSRAAPEPAAARSSRAVTTATSR